VNKDSIMDNGEQKTMQQLHILFNEDTPSDADLLEHAIRKAGFDVVPTRVDTREEFLGALREFAPDVIISDYRLPTFNGMEALELAKEHAPFTPFIITTGAMNEEIAVECMKAGADDYLLKDRMLRIGPAIEAALAKKKALMEKQRAEQILIISERECRAGQEKYRQLSQEFNTLLDAIPDRILLQSPELEIVWANRAARENFRDTFPGKEDRHCYRLIHETSVPHENCPVLECFRTGHPAKKVISVRGELTFEVRAVPLRNEDGNLVNVIEICRDISETKKLEQQLFHAQKMEAVGQLAGGIAHDFNNIITALIGYGNLVLMKMAADDPLRHYLEQMLTTAERAGELTQGLLAFSRKKEPNMLPMNVNDIIRTSEKFLARVIGEDVEMRTTLAAEPLIALVDHSQLEQVLTNLASNARDAMPDGGTLSITTSRCEIDGNFVRLNGYGEQGRYLKIDVTDTGMGMDEKTRSKIFEPFFTTKEQGKGTGLGLSIVYGIIKGQRGYINVSSREGQGTTFSIYLPLVEEVFRRKEFIPTPQPAGGSETILIAEDDDWVRETSCKFLRDFGYTVLEAADGEEAVEKFSGAKDSINLLILDVLMPKKGGREVCEQARALRPDIKVLFNSGYPLDVLQSKGVLEAGVHYYLKPIAPRDLLSRVREVLEQ
jgi:signal transduction histidine kinase/DNA-binding response OmpR family regulator